jgi:hypothetical protein
VARLDDAAATSKHDAGPTLVLLFGDHGMTAEGNHGGATDAETHAGFFAWDAGPTAAPFEGGQGRGSGAGRSWLSFSSGAWDDADGWGANRRQSSDGRGGRSRVTEAARARRAVIAQVGTGGGEFEVHVTQVCPRHITATKKKRLL